MTTTAQSKKLQTILYVEDEPDIRTIGEMILVDLGNYDVQSCQSGAEALRSVENRVPDLILLDVMMPHMDGPTTMTHLRNLPQSAQVPVVFMTAKIAPHEIRQYQELGAVGVIAKPFDPLSLIKQLEEIWRTIHAETRQHTK